MRGTLGRLRFLLLLSWGVYPIAYLLPLLDVSGADAWVGKQVGYSIADIVAKAVYALIILHVAKVKSYDDDHAFAAVETSWADAPEREAPVEHGVASEGEALARVRSRPVGGSWRAGRRPPGDGHGAQSGAQRRKRIAGPARPGRRRPARARRPRRRD